MSVICDAAHNCTSFNDKNHGYGCELRNVKPDDVSDFEINVMSKDELNRTDSSVTWVQIRDSQFNQNLPKGVFEKFVNMEKIMILNSQGFENLQIAYFDKKITLILMKATDLETVGENCLVGLGNLKTLSLNYNNIKKVHKNAFRDLVKVEKVEMVYNKIEMLDEDTFANNVNLKTVLLYNNLLKVISTPLFSRNTNLESIQVQSNQILQIEKGFYITLTKLTRLDLSSNICISETLTPTRFIQWASFQYKFKDCYNNYLLMKSTNEVIDSVQTKIESLETKVSGAVERVDTDLKILEGKIDNSTAFGELKTNLLKFFEADKDFIRESYKEDLQNITSHVRTEMIEEIEKNVEKVLNENQKSQQEKLVSNDFETFRDEFSKKFTFIYFTLFILVCLVSVTIFFIAKQIFPAKQGHGDGRHLIEENC